MPPPPLPAGAPKIRLRLWLALALLATLAVLAPAAVRASGDYVAAGLHLEPGVAVLAVRAGPGGAAGSLPELSGTSADLSVEVTVRNRNLVDVTVRAVRWTALLNGGAVASGTVLDPPQGVRIPADGARQVQIAATVALARASLAGLGAVLSGSAKAEIRGTAQASVFGLCVHREFVLPLHDLRPTWVAA
ncbi:MAG: LEA type 2 family protein, partial [Deltaproteobacteria bacterium]|nr:LEA type 2 family protein [Deltaproteobacteria bacterium]